MRQRVADAGARGLVVGLSGGIDSAVVARLCQIAAPGATVGVLMPCHSDASDERDAALVATHFSIPTIRIDLTQPYDTLVRTVTGSMSALPASSHADHPPDDPRARVPLANIKPRMRMTSLYFVANSLNYLVAGTGNRSELAIGYFTKYGDGGVDILPLANLVKSDVVALARELDVPDAIVNRTPTAGLWLGQTDESEMGFTYDQLESYLNGMQGLDPAMGTKIERLVHASDHKRHMAQAPPVE